MSCVECHINRVTNITYWARLTSVQTLPACPLNRVDVVVPAVVRAVPGDAAPGIAGVVDGEDVLLGHRVAHDTAVTQDVQQQPTVAPVPSHGVNVLDRQAADALAVKEVVPPLMIPPPAEVDWVFFGGGATD